MTNAITKITPATCDMLRKELNDVLRPLAEKYGVDIKIGKMGYMSENIKVPLEISVISETGVPQTREADAFKQLAFVYGMKPTDLGLTFIIQGVGYQIIGARSRSDKFPIICKRLTDNATVCYADTVVARKLGYPPKEFSGTVREFQAR